MSRPEPDVVGCRRKVTQWIKKTTSIPKTKKKEELPMKLLDDPKIPTSRRNPRRPHNSHKLLDIATETGLKLGRPYCTRRCHHHLSAAPTNPKNKEQSPQNKGQSPPTDKGQDPPRLHGPKAIETGRFVTVLAGG
jgi:hypothetical protein